MTEDELRHLLNLTQIKPAPIEDEENQSMADISSKGFDVIAASIKDLPLLENRICTSEEDANALRSFIANYLAGDLRRTNARFDRYRFIAACQPDPPKEHAPAPNEDWEPVEPDEDLDEEDNDG